MATELSLQVQGTFESMLARAQAKAKARKESAEPHLLVGTATCGQAAGALEVLRTLDEELARRNIKATIAQVGCMGYCYAEPLVVLSQPGYPPILYGYVNPGIATRLVQDFLAGDDPCLEFALGALEENELVPTVFDQPRFKYEKRVVLANCGYIDPEDMDDYIARGGYQGLAQALVAAPAEVIAEVKASGLRGRGGAGFPTGLKWEICHQAPSIPKYLVCNADEGDPGAFMDRAILESDPHSVIEGMAIGAYAIGASQGYIYVRQEYPLAVERVQKALHQAEEAGLLGENILKSGFSFHVKVMLGSGAFVCGEETALIASIEGGRGMPRHRPPFPATEGLWGRPTVINNVKTFASVSRVMERGAVWFASTGSEKSKGTAVFALAGKVVNTGLVEVPMGTTLRHLIYEVGGGIQGGKRFKAVQIGGPSGGSLPESLLDTPIDFDSLHEAGAIMGSGGLVVLDEDNCMVDAARYFLDFTQKESCGQCTMCRLGTREMLDRLEAFTRGEGELSDIDLLVDLAQDIKEGSLCALGRTAPNPVLTTIRYFGDEYRAHISEKRCPARACTELTAYYILPEKCERSCDACVGTCTVEAISTGKRRVKVIDQSKCVKCGTCLEACPPQYSAVVKLSPKSLVPPPE